MQMYYDKDANLEILKGKRIGVVGGAGIQGSGQSLNLQDSGLDVVVSELPDTPAWKKAEQQGLTVMTTPELAQ
ncbi:MAG: ketol-acid reductoisomerase, partial [Candidatus Latescibacteria bacterium]|nr:ketol-acid reductoisomerase [Candidatus Latescibacterota bacterium]